MRSKLRPMALCFLALFGLLIVGSFLHGQDCKWSNSFVTTIASVKGIQQAVYVYDAKYKSLPGQGELRKAIPCKLQPSCSRTVQIISQNNAFWAALLNENTVGAVEKTKIEGAYLNFRKTDLGDLIAVSWDDKLLPPEIVRPDESKKIVLVLTKAEAIPNSTSFNEENNLTISPQIAAQIDKKLDDGNAHSGYIQSFGSVRCFSPDTGNSITDRILSYFKTADSSGYNKSENKNECGLVFFMK